MKSKIIKINEWFQSESAYPEDINDDLQLFLWYACTIGVSGALQNEMWKPIKSFFFPKEKGRIQYITSIWLVNFPQQIKKKKA